MQTLAFHGGTALRFLYDIPRYSEDLDFALERMSEAYDFRSYLQQILMNPNMKQIKSSHFLNYSVLY